MCAHIQFDYIKGGEGQTWHEMISKNKDVLIVSSPGVRKRNGIISAVHILTI